MPKLPMFEKHRKFEQSEHSTTNGFSNHLLVGPTHADFTRWHPLGVRQYFENISTTAKIIRRYVEVLQDEIRGSSVFHTRCLQDKKRWAANAHLGREHALALRQVYETRGTQQCRCLLTDPLDGPLAARGPRDGTRGSPCDSPHVALSAQRWCAQRCIASWDWRALPEDARRWEDLLLAHRSR